MQAVEMMMQKVFHGFLVFAMLPMGLTIDAEG